jgi:hypothetical protein
MLLLFMSVCPAATCPAVLACIPRSMLLVDYKQFVAQPEATVRQVLQFVGADTSRWARL